MSDGKWWRESWQVVDGCTPVSAGCDRCWARVMQRRFPKTHGKPGTVRFRTDRLDAPLHWRKPQIVAVWNDLFHEAVKPNDIVNAFVEMSVATRHRFVVLTKRIDRVAKVLRLDASLPNVWLGTSAENQETFNERAPYLAQLAAGGWNTVLSCEPLLGPIDLWGAEELVALCPNCHTGLSDMNDSCPTCSWQNIDNDGEVLRGVGWLIAGGETGAGARPAHPNWFRSLRDQCVAAGVPFWFKGWGEWATDNCGADSIGQVAPDGWSAEGYGPCGYGREHRGVVQVYRVGHKRAGRELDGREWNERPF